MHEQHQGSGAFFMVVLIIQNIGIISAAVAKFRNYLTSSPTLTSTLFEEPEDVLFSFYYSKFRNVNRNYLGNNLTNFFIYYHHHP